jgi:hypothetical protein
MSRRLYKCEGFCDECWLENKCVIKSTFNPQHIWKRSRYVSECQRNLKSMTVKCNRDDSIKEVKPCL